MSQPLLILNIVGLTPKLLKHMPKVSAVAQGGTNASITPVLPAVTCSMQATFLTGLTPTDHGIVGNGWYFRDLGEPLLWRQHNALIQGEKIWDTARKNKPQFKTANICWWYAQGANTELLVTPKPVYHADGRKDPDCYTVPPQLHAELEAAHGRFPLFQYWGPTAGLASSEWIAKATIQVLNTHNPQLTLAYLPHLDYDLQRFGPNGPEAIKAAQDIDVVAGSVIAAAQKSGANVIVLSEYGITPVSRPVHINQALRQAGLLKVSTQAGMEYLDTFTSDAFAVSDHQIAHVYVRDPSRIKEVHDVLTALPGIAQVLDDKTKAAAGLAHERSGELIAIAEPESWFTYYYWLDQALAPDFAHIVDIHRKPGYDPVELFFNPHDKWVKARAGFALAKKKAGMRYLMNVVSLDATLVKGSHGRLPSKPADGPVFLSSNDLGVGDSIHATDVRDLFLKALEI